MIVASIGQRHCVLTAKSHHCLHPAVRTKQRALRPGSDVKGNTSYGRSVLCSATDVSKGGGRPVLNNESWEQTMRSATPVFPRDSAPKEKLRVFSGTSNRALSEEVACYLGLDL